MNDYLEYLEKYCDTYKISKEEAEKHLLVQAVKKMYFDKEAESVQDDREKNI